MTLPRSSRKRADIAAISALVGGLLVLGYTGLWWPWIIIVVAIAVLARQYLREHFYDMVVSSVVFSGLFLTIGLEINWNVVAPVIFTIGAVFILFRECLATRREEPTVESDDLKGDIDDGASS